MMLAVSPDRLSTADGLTASAKLFDEGKDLRSALLLPFQEHDANRNDYTVDGHQNAVIEEHLRAYRQE